MIIPPSVRKVATSYPPLPIRIGSSNISFVQLLKILGVTLSSTLSWNEHAQNVCSKVARKLGVLRQISNSLNARTRAHVYKVFIKPDIDFYLPIWSQCGAAHTRRLNKLLQKVKRIITHDKSATVTNSDYKIYCLADFNSIAMYVSVCQFFNFVHVSSQNDLLFTLFCTINISDKSTSTRASLANKLQVPKSKHSCDNCFLYTAPKLWNKLPNNVTCKSDFKNFRAGAAKVIFI